jgi:hypothetical protein
MTPANTPNLPLALRMIEAAIAAGTHSRHHQTVCEQCRRWVPAIHYITFDGRRICQPCATGVSPPRTLARPLTSNL